MVENKQSGSLCSLDVTKVNSHSHKSGMFKEHESNTWLPFPSLAVVINPKWLHHYTVYEITTSLTYFFFICLTFPLFIIKWSHHFQTSSSVHKQQSLVIFQGTNLMRLWCQHHGNCVSYHGHDTYDEGVTMITGINSFLTNGPHPPSTSLYGEKWVHPGK